MLPLSIWGPNWAKALFSSRQRGQTEAMETAIRDLVPLLRYAIAGLLVDELKASDEPRASLCSFL